MFRACLVRVRLSLDACVVFVLRLFGWLVGACLVIVCRLPGACLAHARWVFNAWLAFARGLRCVCVVRGWCSVGAWLVIVLRVCGKCLVPVLCLVCFCASPVGCVFGPCLLLRVLCLVGSCLVACFVFALCKLGVRGLRSLRVFCCVSVVVVMCLFEMCVAHALRLLCLRGNCLGVWLVFGWCLVGVRVVRVWRVLCFFGVSLVRAWYAFGVCRGVLFCVSFVFNLCAAGVCFLACLVRGWCAFDICCVRSAFAWCWLNGWLAVVTCFAVVCLNCKRGPLSVTQLQRNCNNPYRCCCRRCRCSLLSVCV